MARIESISVGGYYPTPTRVVPLLASLFKVVPEGHYNYLDPCAGEGAAVLSLIKTLHGEERKAVENVDLRCVEMELTRYASLKEACGTLSWHWGTTQNALHCDAFCVHFKVSEGVSLLYLNPPYDTDPVCGRLEEKFLLRFTPTLMAGGLLVFLVPFYALSASAKTLAKEYSSVACFRFPEPEFSGYKQVALIATKRESALFEPDPKIEAKVQKWAKDASSIPVLEEGVKSFTVPQGGKWGKPFDTWKTTSVDFAGLLERVKPWSVTDRAGKTQPIVGIMPEGAVEDLLIRRYPVAMPPRSAHIAAGIAAGIFNGSRINPDDPKSKLPPILVKGVFDKEFRTVEQKEDKDGNVKALVQVQQPKLVTTVLDLRNSTYHTIKASADQTGSQDLATMTMADLLAEYGRGLMAVMLQQCPVLHDPGRTEDHIQLGKVARPLFQAQSHATQAAVKLLGGLDATKASRRFKSAFVLGEIGSGKTSVALAAAETVKSKRTLVMCPPHLLQSWIDQTAAVTPWVRAVVLSDILDMQKLAASEDEGPVIAILSREAAKLGHGYASVSGNCPGCGEELADRDFAKKRETCDSKQLAPRDAVGKLAVNLALSLVKVFPRDFRLSQILRTRPLRALIERLRADNQDEDTKPGFNYAGWKAAEATFDAVIDALLEDDREGAWHAILALLMAVPKPARAMRVARAAFAKNDVKRAKMALLLTGDSPEVAALVAEMKASEGGRYYSPSWDPWKNWANKRAYLQTGAGESAHDYDTEDFKREKGAKTFTWKGCEYGNPKSAAEAVGFLATTAFFAWTEECGERLFQAVPEPRRYPIATFIARRYPDFFDLLILDECHEYATDGAAQERSAHRLTSLGLPTLALTGTIMNGYAESMFTNMWALSKEFRQEFDRDERARFVDRYGYRKRLVQDRDKESGEIVEYGSMSDRVERTERTIGHAPGVLPLFLLKYLLPQAVTLHKTDLAVDIPNCTEQVETVVPEEELLKRYRGLERALLDQIRKDRFEKDLAGKLWGAMADLPSYLDLATEDTGNRDGGCYSIRYPESVGGDLVAAAEPFPLTMILPKEAWLLDQVQEALDSDRNVMVFAWHTALLPRLSRLLEKRLKTKCPILDPGKVPTKNRQTWIDEQIVRKGRRVLVVNPVAIQTGLNNLVYFSDQIWMENPMCNPTIYRQGVGRVDRIGQEKLTRIFFPLYSGTSQVALHSLLMQKVAVSMSTDGLDAESALRAAGIGEDSGFSSFAVGRQLYEMLVSGRVPDKVTAPKKKRPAPPKLRAMAEEDLFAYAMQLE